MFTGKDVGDVKQEGLKTILIKSSKRSKNILNETDWYVTRKSEESTMDSVRLQTWRKEQNRQRWKQQSQIVRQTQQQYKLYIHIQLKME